MKRNEAKKNQASIITYQPHMACTRPGMLASSRTGHFSQWTAITSIKVLPNRARREQWPVWEWRSGSEEWKRLKYSAVGGDQRETSFEDFSFHDELPAIDKPALIFSSFCIKAKGQPLRLKENAVINGYFNLVDTYPAFSKAQNGHHYLHHT